jgi:aminopeptidase N
MAHPVRPDSYVEINNFYTPTIYEKGAEVVRMMQSLVGREGFERGITLYFQRHDGQAVTCDDFAQAIADANPAASWPAPAAVQALVRPGGHAAAGGARPVRRAVAHLHPRPRAVAAAVGRRGGARALRHSAGDRPAGARRPGDAASPRGRARGRGATNRMLVLDETKAFFTFVDVDEPPVLSLLRGFSAPVCLFDGLGDAELVILLRHDSDPFNRWEAGQRLALNRLLAAIAGDARGAARRRLRRGDARGAARAVARPGVQGAGC